MNLRDILVSSGFTFTVMHDDVSKEYVAMLFPRTVPSTTINTLFYAGCCDWNEKMLRLETNPRLPIGRAANMERAIIRLELRLEQLAYDVMMGREWREEVRFAFSEINLPIRK